MQHVFRHIIVPPSKPSQVFRAFAQPVPTKAFHGAALAFALPPCFRLGTGLGCGTLGHRRGSTLNGLEIFQEFHIVRNMGQVGGLLRTN